MPIKLSDKVPLLHITLFALTFLSTVGAGMIQRGINPLTDLYRWDEGLPFAVTLLAILLSHELAHYVSSIKNRTMATLPYFIPAPSIIGTFGAFIKMKGPIRTRSALIDIGSSGPIVGFVVSTAACVVGLTLSEVVNLNGSEGGLMLGESLLFKVLSYIVIGSPPKGYDVMLHPVAFAGWIGFLVTSLNLIPIGQLDGGHILYALLGNRHQAISKVLLLILALMGLFFWVGWVVWALLLALLGTKHPPVIVWEEPLDQSRKVAAIASYMIFFITFMPRPFIIT